jgi:diguanylate cyclase (GGDEF)-like protein/PAS domain S-box-containing protein
MEPSRLKFGRAHAMNTRTMDGATEVGDLRAERDRALALLEAIDAGYLVSHEGRVVEVNDVLCRLVGFTRQELIGVGLPWPFWPPESLSTSYEIRDALVARGLDFGTPTTVEVPLMHKDGRRFIGEVTVARAVMPDGTFIGWVNTVREVSERRNHELDLQGLATHDPLTGLPNRHLFDERLDEQMTDAIRHQRPLAVAILDLDHFKAVNDAHGNMVGDQVLNAIVERVSDGLRKGDLLARIGGAEFGLILSEVFAQGALAAAERARLAVADRDFGVAGRLTISVGVALRGDLREASAMYEHADQALYQAKREGRNRTVIWTPSHSVASA